MLLAIRQKPRSIFFCQKKGSCARRITAKTLKQIGQNIIFSLKHVELYDHVIVIYFFSSLLEALLITNKNGKWILLIFISNLCDDIFSATQRKYRRIKA